MNADAVKGGGVTIRLAGREDLRAIVKLLADDVLGAGREAAAEDLEPYAAAFDEIDADPRNCIYVAVENGEVIGCYQLTLIANLSLTGTRRAQIEGVRVAKAARGRQIGEALMRHAIGRAREEGCGLVQLTSNKTRADALRFYARLGFEATHIGFKLYL